MKRQPKSTIFFAFREDFGEKNKTANLWDFADVSIRKTQQFSPLATNIKNVIEDLYKRKAISYKFPMITLDQFAKREKIQKIDLLKIDVEGYELSVLQGSKKLLKTNRILLIQFEFNEMNIFTRTFFKDFVDILPSYIFYRIMPRGLYKLGKYQPITYEIFAYQNILAVHNNMEGVIKRF